MPLPTHRRRSRRGFTLAEILIVIGIIVALAAIILPTISLMNKRAHIERARADLNTIALGLDEYKNVFGDYPRFADPAADVEAQSAGGQYNGLWLDTATDRGARLLCRALIGPGNAGTTTATTGSGKLVSVATPGDDGADGPGFRGTRIVAGGLTGGTPVLSGKVFGPFLDVAKFKVRTNLVGAQDAVILDTFGRPVLYYPAQPGGFRPNATVRTSSGSANPNAYVMAVPPLAVQPGDTKPYYNAFDNSAGTPAAAGGMGDHLLTEPQLQSILGNGNPAVTVAPFLLWSAGPDEVFGFTGTPPRIDDVVYNVVLPTAPIKVGP